jgi:hypothetical protein
LCFQATASSLEKSHGNLKCRMIVSRHFL